MAIYNIDSAEIFAMGEAAGIRRRNCLDKLFAGAIPDEFVEMEDTEVIPPSGAIQQPIGTLGRHGKIVLGGPAEWPVGVTLNARFFTYPNGPVNGNEAPFVTTMTDPLDVAIEWANFIDGINDLTTEGVESDGTTATILVGPFATGERIEIEDLVVTPP